MESLWGLARDFANNHRNEWSFMKKEKFWVRIIHGLGYNLDHRHCKVCDKAIDPDYSYCVEHDNVKPQDSTLGEPLKKTRCTVCLSDSLTGPCKVCGYDFARCGNWSCRPGGIILTGYYPSERTIWVWRFTLSHEKDRKPIRKGRMVILHGLTYHCGNLSYKKDVGIPWKNVNLLQDKESGGTYLCFKCRCGEYHRIPQTVHIMAGTDEAYDQHITNLADLAWIKWKVRASE